MRLLVVDDDEHLRASLREHFEAEAFAVDVAKDGEEGSYTARTNSYNLIILDCNLPKKSGREVCAEIRSAGGSVPILAISVESKIEHKLGLFNAGADDYLIKPFSSLELLARVRALLRRPAVYEQNRFSVADLILDRDRHIVMRGNKMLYLTVKEFGILELLVRNKDRVTSRTALMEEVWEKDLDPFSNTIETHIVNLRRKIDAGRKPLIHTVPGRGYKLSKSPL